MNTAVSLPGKNDDEATKIAMGYRWYIFEGMAEGNRADMALLSEEEAKIIKKFFDNKIEFYDEGYAGTYDMLDCGPFVSKEEAVNQFIEDGIHTDCLGGTFRLRHPEDLVDEFKDMYKEKKDSFTLEESMQMYRNSIACKMLEAIRKDCEEDE